MLKEELRKKLVQKASERDIEQWFDPLALSRSADGRIQVRFPHHLFFEWFNVRFRHLFEEAICFCSNSKDLPLYLAGSDCVINVPPAFPYEPPRGGMPEQNRETQGLAVNWNNDCSGDHSFENFLYNRKNEYPVAAAREFSKLEGASPFTIYAQNGCGKTHLLSSIYREIKTFVPENNIFYGKLSDLETIIENNEKSGNPLFVPFIETKVFIIDNFQECAGKAQLQKKLVTLIELCSEQNIHLALSLDSTPAQWDFLDAKIRSMLESGLIIEIKKPDLDIKTKYILEQSGLLDLKIAKSDALNLARSYSEFRQILGALLKIYSFKSHAPENASLDLENILKSSRPSAMLTPDTVLGCVSEHYGFSVEDLRGKNRSRELALARHVCMYLLRRLLAAPLSVIGDLMGRDHSSVIYSVNKIEDLLKTNNEMNKTVTTLKQLCETRAKIPKAVRNGR